MALMELDRYSICWKSPHGSLTMLSIDMALFYDNQNTRRPQLRPFGSVKFLNQSTRHYVAPHHPHPSSPSSPFTLRSSPFAPHHPHPSPLHPHPFTLHPSPLAILIRPRNKLSKMAGSSASYPMYSTYNELCLIHSYT